MLFLRLLAYPKGPDEPIIFRVHFQKGKGNRDGGYILSAASR